MDKYEYFNNVVLAYDADAFKAECWAMYGFPDVLAVSHNVTTVMHNGTGINLRYARLPNGKRAMFYTCDGSVQNWNNVDDFMATFCPATVIRGKLSGFHDFPYMMHRRSMYPLDPL